MRRAIEFRKTPVILLALAIWHCSQGERTAGTSTTVTNPALQGVAIFLDGKPAAGARVHLRTTEYRLTPEGKPFALLAGSDTVDDTGGFALPMPEVQVKEHYLAFQQAAPPGGGPGGDSLEVQLRRWQDGLPHDGLLGTFRLGKPGGLAGRLAFEDGAAPAVRWIGDRGTDNFSAVAADGAFRLVGMAPGLHHLVLVSVAPAASSPGDSTAMVVDDFIAQDSVKAGEIRNIGEVRPLGR